LPTKKNNLRVFHLGGLGEIGKNMTVLEYGNDIIIIDCGVAFPQHEMLGIDLVIPDFTYLVQNAHKIRGLFLTHAHEDHIGSVPYFLREVNVRIFGTRLTLGLVANKLKEHGLSSIAEMTCINPGEAITAGCFEVEFIRVTHSVVDSVAIAVDTPVGLVIHSGDFKVDFTPIQGEPMDLQRFAVLGDQGVLLYLCESTNVLYKGYTMSERTVGRVFEQVFEDSPTQRIMIAMFSSNIDRIQQVITSAVRHQRKTLFMGRSMINAVKTASELGYLDIPKGAVIDVNEARNYTPQQLCIVTTGSQGEQMAALSRMAASDHRQIVVTPSDKIIISASPIPGNERMISRVINDLLKLGAEVIYEGMMEVHVSGHAKEEELKLMHALIRPKYLLPVHGEYRHLKHHKDLAIAMGIPKANVFLMDIGQVLELTQNSAKINGTVPSGQLLVDGLGVGDVGNVVLRDRKHLSEDGLIIVAVGVAFEDHTCHILSGPDIISRGFVYVRENDDLMQNARAQVTDTLYDLGEKNNHDMNHIRNQIRDNLKEFIWQRTKRNPMIFPIIMEL
jgi:ribonuclease J